MDVYVRSGAWGLLFWSGAWELNKKIISLNYFNFQYEIVILVAWSSIQTQFGPYALDEIFFLTVESTTVVVNLRLFELYINSCRDICIWQNLNSLVSASLEFFLYTFLIASYLFFNKNLNYSYKFELRIVTTRNSWLFRHVNIKS